MCCLAFASAMRRSCRGDIVDSNKSTSEVRDYRACRFSNAVVEAGEVFVMTVEKDGLNFELVCLPKPKSRACCSGRGRTR